MRCLYVYNKVDMCTLEECDEIARREHSVPVSASLHLGLDSLLARMWDEMALCRVYTKKTGHKPDFGDPVVLTTARGGTTVEALCRQLHNSLAREFAYALVWGRSVKHAPQRVGLAHGLCDEDVAQIVKKKVVGAGEDGRGRFKTTASGPDRIADRVKKAPLKS